ncbi:MAG TPA: chromosome segregation protein SMC [Acetobacteraceae bacterium]|nr:chromosome segregation protein SMC [Acetobacteraceae bacterium]
MPVSFSKLRITGFKSFAEPTGVDILPGLTGIVGPNGCGKSNIVEALRWAMGESSARGLRGGEMEDVIFAGTAGRPSRNIAEVVVTLNDTHGVAPPPFHEHAELEIQRRIERGAGSDYRINGKEARARDVQTLFADLASGARASAMVSQGRVGALVAARPEERRAVLEEAAGITGLHARRHEAELKLRAAETNLARAEDLRGQLETQLGSLKRQARQASRYRNISGAIRTAEAELLSILRAKVDADRAAADSAVRDAEWSVAEATNLVSATQAAATETAEALSPLRESESETRTTLERHRVAREHIAAEENRARGALSAARGRLAQLRTDLDHAEQIRTDAMAAEARLVSEDTVLAEADAAWPDKAGAAESEAIAGADCARVADRDANSATEAAAEANAQAQSALQAMNQAEQRVRRLMDQLMGLRDERERFAGQQIDVATLEQSAAEYADAQAALTEARAAVEAAEQEHAAAASALATAREDWSRAEGARAKLAAEIQALAEVLAVRDGERWPPMIDSLSAPSGLETALGAALGEELTSALDPEADRHWRELPPLASAPSLPAAAPSLLGMVEAPAALARSLSQIALVEDERVALDCQADLAPGQMLVSREGAIWRWDGYTIRAGTPTAAAVRLRQRNRLSVLREALTDAEQVSERANAAQTEAEQLARTAALSEQLARSTRRDAEAGFERATAALTSLRSQATTAAARLAAADEQLARLEQEHQEAFAALEVARAAYAARPDVDGLREAVERSRVALAEARSRESAALSARNSLAREHAICVDRRSAIASERTLWTDRAREADARVADLLSRLDVAQAEMTALETAPNEAAARQAEAQEALRLAEMLHQQAAQALSEATAAAGEAERAARAAEAALSSRREAAVRAEGLAEQANHAWGALAERILERLGANPTLPDPPDDLTTEIEDKARRRHERLVKERDEMGPVNLRAETEAEAIEQQIATIDSERAELLTAIARLRGSIGALNREGRERLNEVFQAIDRHFQQLFTRMFGGGRAHLALVGSDDPLLAGLEIYAQPPGKKLAALSLLSGGEQALTALSLIFAVFRCNPAPICVLDEVDAPLDDANVERFCMLLEDIERETKTRFLVVTHHPMTMARMNRLYGVTMQERGVSRLLSVDLARAAAMVEQRQLPLEDQTRLAAD